MQRPHIIIYIIGVAAVWATILGVMWSTGNMVRVNTYASVCLGFVLGMVAMYLATRVYRS